MALTFLPQALEDSEGLTLIAKDEVSRTVLLIKVHRDVVEEVGIEGAQWAAQAKYEAGLFEHDGSISVRIGDVSGSRSV